MSFLNNCRCAKIHFYTRNIKANNINVTILNKYQNEKKYNTTSTRTPIMFIQ
jgi:hypothetical protein